jgi:GxxExxY protein
MVEYCSVNLYTLFDMDENEISYTIRGCIFRVFNNLGPGLLESAYQSALLYEIKKAGLRVRANVSVPIMYESIEIDNGYRLDIVVENKVIVEVKSVETLSKVHHKQLITYLRLSELRLGLLVNFNTDDISTSIVRKINSF